MKSKFTLILVFGMLLPFSSFAYGSAELFIRVDMLNGAEHYSIRVDDQEVSNTNGRFRFFELMPGKKEVFLKRNGYNLYKGIVTVYANLRIVVEYRGNRGLMLVDRIRLNAGNQTIQSWYVWNYLYPNFGGNQTNTANPGWGNNNHQNPHHGRPLGMDGNLFNVFKQTVQKQSFDKDKAITVKNQAPMANFNSVQVAELLDLFSFENYKLDVAKYCFDHVADPEAYFKTFEKFQFSSNVSELSNYIAGKR